MHMRLVELCLLPLLSAQEPAPQQPPPPAPVAESAPEIAPNPPVAKDPREALLAAEKKGADADAATLSALTSADDAAIAARAAWLLGQCNSPQVLEMSRKVAAQSPHATARLQAMSTLLRKPEIGSFQSALAALDDDDMQVRALAAQLLGKLRRPAAVEPLAGVVERKGRKANEPAVDVQAALLALRDHDAATHLLRVATALHDVPAQGIGQTLAYCFQELLPKLDEEQQTTVLLAVLDHHEPMVRRYAIGRLTELADPKTVKALEGSLAKENAELRPLIEVAIAQIRRDLAPAEESRAEKAKAKAKELWAVAKKRWDGLSLEERVIVGATPLALLVMFVLFLRLRRRRRTAEDAAHAIALVAPSQEHLQEMQDEELEGQAWDEVPEEDGEVVEYADDGGYRN
jgi:hypothetical protein